MSIASRLKSLEFWKPALVAPFVVANLPAAAVDKLSDALSRPIMDLGDGHGKKRWAKLVQYYDAGKRLYQVDANLYRGAQPSFDGFADLAEMGIRTVVNLRRHYKEEALVRSLGMRPVRIGVNTLAPNAGQLAEFLRIATDPARGPVFVHCLHGADRTGMMCAAYRVVVQNWTVQQALDEWLNGPFGFHRVFNHLRPLFKSLDFDRLARLVFDRDAELKDTDRENAERQIDPEHL